MANRVHQPVEQIVANVCNQSARSTAICAIVLHDTESHDRQGLTDLQGLVAFFNTPSVQASAHIIVDEEGNTARCVPDERKAWHVAGYNSQTLGIEQVGFATFTRAIWDRNKRAQLRKVAKWIAWWSKEHNIPIRVGAVRNGAVTSPGVLTHAMLGQIGGGHHDPGPNYPLNTVLALARWYAKHGWR